jgi:hypothetical protein
MRDPFYSAKRTLERAKYHFRDFKARVAAFANTKQGTYVTQRDENRIYNIHKIKFEKAFFDEVPSIVFDALNNLRATLDQTIYGATIASGIGPKRLTNFPFGETPADVEKAVKGWCKEAPDEIKAILPTFKPYKGGNIALWNLNRLCNLKKHAILMPIATDDLQVNLGKSGGLTLLLGHQWVPENYEIEILGHGGADFSKAHSFAFSIAFDDTETWVRRSAPLAVLRAMISEVQGVLVRIEAESRKFWPKSFA